MQELQGDMSKKELKKVITQMKDDPVLFARKINGFDPDPHQEKMLRAYGNNRRVAMKAGHGVGKTAVTANIILHHLFCYPYSKTISTAPTSRQVSDIMWSEIKKWAKNKYNLLNECEDLKTSLRISEDWFATGQSSSRPENMEGYHAENILYVVDEAKGVPDEIFEAIEGALTTDAKMVVISTPGSPSGKFYKYFSDESYKKNWETISINGEEVERVSKEWVEEKKSTWGEESAIYKARVKGEFPDSLGDMLIPLSYVEDSYQKYHGKNGKDEIDFKNNPDYRLEEKRLGIDVATRGRDLAVLVHVNVYVPTDIPDEEDEDEHRIYVMEEMREKHTTNTTKLAGEAIAMDNDNNYDLINCDYTGNGEGVVDNLKDNDSTANKTVGLIMGSNPEGEDKQGVPYRKRFTNIKAKVFWDMRKRFINGQVYIPEKDSLIGELTAMGYEYTSSGKTKITDPEAKDLQQQRRFADNGRGGNSPDHADALCYAMADTQKTKEPFILEGGNEVFNQGTPDPQDLTGDINI